jgi:putative ABC transport system permease protein
MWKNYLVSALGNLRRNRLYAAINIVGLALGVAAALLIALFVRDELNYDRFQGHRDVYLLTATERFLDHRMRDQRWDFSLPDLAPQLRVELPQAAAIARVMRSRQSPHVRSGRVEADEAGFDWADGALFEIMPQTVLAGDVRTALTTPDAVVLTRSMARKYFGRDTPLGETLEVDPAMGPAAAQISPSFNRPHPMKVAAVIEDLPSNTYLKGELFGSSVTSYSPFALYDQTKDEGPFRGWSTYTFIRLKPNVPLGGVETQLASFALRHIPVYPPGFRVGLQLTPIADVHLSPSGAVEMTPLAASFSYRRRSTS